MKTVEYDIHAESLDSTVLESIWYDGKNQELYVQFCGSGQIAGYKGLLPSNVEAMVRAGSIGSFYAKNVKNKYAGISGDVEFKKRELKTAVVTESYQITGNVLRPTIISDTIVASSFEEAMTKFVEKYKGLDPQVRGISK